MAALGSAVYSIANSQRFVGFFKKMSKVDIVCGIAEQAVMLIIMCNILIFLMFVGIEKLCLYSYGRYDNNTLNMKSEEI